VLQGAATRRAMRVHGKTGSRVASSALHTAGQGKFGDWNDDNRKDGMDSTIAAVLLLDGIGNGAVYALLGMAIVLVFAVTRVILIPQGEFVAYSALTLAMLQLGRVPGTVWLALLLAALAVLRELWDGLRAKRAWSATGLEIARLCALPVAAAAVTYVASGQQWPLALQGLLTLVLVTSLGPLVYRLAYQPLADASVLLLLIVSVGVHFTLVGLGLVFFGAEGYRTPPFWDASFAAGAVTISGQTIVTVAASALLMGALYLFFARTLAGKALRATAINRLGARLMGVSTEHAGRSAFSMAAFIGALSGLLIGPTTTMIYDGGFLIGLKGFVAAIFGGLASYPLAVGGALLVGLLDSFSSFWASAYKDVIVFTAIIPILLLRSLTDGQHDDDE
jgi:branched-chain amino acid transport system permease protein